MPPVSYIGQDVAPVRRAATGCGAPGRAPRLSAGPAAVLPQRPGTGAGLQRGDGDTAVDPALGAAAVRGGTPHGRDGGPRRPPAGPLTTASPGRTRRRRRPAAGTPPGPSRRAAAAPPPPA